MWREKIDKLGFLETKNFYSGTVKKNEETNYRLGEVFVNYISEKEVVSRIYKDLPNLDNKKII